MTSPTNDNDRIAELEAQIEALQAAQPVRVQFGTQLEAFAEDFLDVVAVDSENVGPMGGKSYQVRGVFTDARGREHGVILNAYVGEPDITITADGQIVGAGNQRRG